MTVLTTCCSVAASLSQQAFCLTLIPFEFRLIVQTTVLYGVCTRNVHIFTIRAYPMAINAAMNHCIYFVHHVFYIIVLYFVRVAIKPYYSTNPTLDILTVFFFLRALRLAHERPAYFRTGSHCPLEPLAFSHWARVLSATATMSPSHHHRPRSAPYRFLLL